MWKDAVSEYDNIDVVEMSYLDCPCASGTGRSLEREDEEDHETWQIAYTTIVLFFMFLALISDRLGADSILLSALMFFMAGQIITVKEALAGFGNEGLWTVMALFVVAEGISKTGALDWYMSKLLGSPKSTAAAQLKLMTPIVFISAFLNNTPVVVVMIPIVQKWAKNIRQSPQQLLIPLSFASILGGTCTLIGTSTNLVVVGLLEDRYENDPSVNVDIGLFDLGQYGVPIALAGIAYVLLASPYLLPGGTAPDAQAAAEEVLLGARLTPWSPAVNRTIRRSGLRDTGGIYLVSVHRAATGNIHRAVSNDFVLNVGDVMYFTVGQDVGTFGDFCAEHALEVLTNEVQEAAEREASAASELELNDSLVHAVDSTWVKPARPHLFTAREEQDSLLVPAAPATGLESILEDTDGGVGVGCSKDSLLQADEDELQRTVNRMTDIIRNTHSNSMTTTGSRGSTKDRQVTMAAVDGLRGPDPPRIVVTVDKDLVVVAINARDRTGLLLDISKGLLRLNLQLHHTEAAVVADRSVSVWRCQGMGDALPDLEEIWSVLSALLSADVGVEAMKKRGLRVIRARVIPGSRLVGKTPEQVNFRQVYQAAIVAVRHAATGRNFTDHLSAVTLAVGDVLILQVSDDSPILKPPPPNFYKQLEETLHQQGQQSSRSSSVQSMLKSAIRRLPSSENEPNPAPSGPVHGSDNNVPFGWESDATQGGVQATDPIIPEVSSATLYQQEQQERAWKDLMVLFHEDRDGSAAPVREFLTAMVIAPGSSFVGKTVEQGGLSKLPDLYLVSIDRPRGMSEAQNNVLNDEERDGDIDASTHSQLLAFEATDPESPLKEGDVLWFSGPASAVGDLRKIPGLMQYQSGQVEQIKDRIHDRRLMQAVIARNGPLVGKTVKEIQFRTRYGAAVIAVHREGQRVHEHPGNVKLQPGDILLLEAGPSFIAKSAQNDRTFALLAEVKNSAPPRMEMLIPALLIAVAMLVVYTAGLTDLVTAALAASFLMVVLGILSEQEARESLKWDVFMAVAAAFGIGTALVNSGVAGGIANIMVGIGEAIGMGDAGLLGAVYLATFLISSIVTNNAAAALMFPVAMDAAEQTGMKLIIMAFCVMLGASASFMTPFGYTTNLLIYGPGGYKYNDFVWFGTPMQIVLWVLSTAFLVLEDQWYISWIAMGLLLFAASMFRIVLGQWMSCGGIATEKSRHD